MDSNSLDTHRKHGRDGERDVQQQHPKNNQSINYVVKGDIFKSPKLEDIQW